MFYQACLNMAEMLDLLGNEKKRAFWLEKAKSLKTSSNIQYSTIPMNIRTEHSGIGLAEGLSMLCSSTVSVVWQKKNC